MHAPMAAPDRILVLRLSSMGDIILMTPVLRLLRQRFSSARIDLVVKAEYAGLFRQDPHVSTVIPLDASGGQRALRALRESLRETAYDVCIDLHNRYRTRFLRRCVPLSRRLVYRRGRVLRWLLVHLGWDLFRETFSVGDAYVRLLAAWGIVDDCAGPALYPGDVDADAARMALDRAGLAADIPYIVFAPGAGTFTKMWPRQHFINAGATIAAASNCRIVLVGGVGDIARCRGIAAGIGPRAVSVAGALDWGASAAVIAGSQGVVGNDSWTAHTAAALGKRSITLFGPTTAAIGYFPTSTDSLTMAMDLSCRPCSHLGSRYCPLGHFRCMQDISAAQVAALARRHLLPAAA